MNIFSIALGPHDQNTYDGSFHNQIERFSRKKHNVPWHHDVYPHHSELTRMNRDDNRYMMKFYNEYWKPEDHEIFCFTTTIGGMKMLRNGNQNIDQDFLDFKPKKLWDYFRKDNIYYIDHHQSHAAYAFLSSCFTESDILSSP